MLLLLIVICLYALVKGHDLVHAVSTIFRSDLDFTINGKQVADREVTSVTWTGNLENLHLDEMSGFARSQYRDDIFYGINDSGGDAELYVLSGSGEDLGTWAINLPLPEDWEDMASYQLDGVSYLIIGDTGDNLRWRDERLLHIVREPDPDIYFEGADIQNTGIKSSYIRGRGQEKRQLSVERTIRFRFPDGPKDCEGLAVDVASDSIYLVSKRVVPAEVFRLPLKAAAKSSSSSNEGYVANEEHAGNKEMVHTAERIARLDKIPQPNERDLLEDPDYGRQRSRPTAFDMWDGLAVVITYQHAYLFEKTGSESWREALSRKPQRIRLPPVTGREAGTLSRDGKFLYVSGERVDGTNPVGIYRVTL